MLALMAADDFENTMRRAKCVKFGLSASIVSRDLTRVHQFINRIEAGLITVCATPQTFTLRAHLEDIAIRLGRERVRRARIAIDLLERYAPESKMSPLGSKDLGIPEV
jgi:hypothetical protein